MRFRFSSVAVLALLLSSLSLCVIRIDPVGQAQQLSIVKQKQIIESFSMPEAISLDSYYWLKIENCSYNSIPGQPMLPVRSFAFKLPEGSSVTGVRVEANESYLQGSFRVVPTPLPVKAGIEDTVGNFSEDPKIYGSSNIFPEQWYVYHHAHGLDPETMVRVEYAIINFYPLRFIPTENEVLRAETVAVTVDYVETATQAQLVKLKNLIITSDALEPYAVQLAEYKNDTGIPSRAVNTTWVYENYGGIDRPEQIRTCIKDFVSTYEIVYVTIFGDADQVSVRYVYVPDGEDGTSTATDLYYSDLDGSWDDNNDGLYADQRYDNVDGIPDVYVGRIPVSLASYAQAAVDKIIGYQSQFNASQSWTRRVILAAGTGSGDGFSNTLGNASTVLKEYISDIVSDKDIVKLYESAGNLSQGNMLNQINNGALFVNFAGHGDPDTGLFSAGWLFYWIIPGLIWNGFGISEVQSLNNGLKLPVVTTMSCSTARFDDMDCLGEWFVGEPNGGSIAYFGATRIAWCFVDGSSPYGLMGEMDWRIYQNYYEGFTRLGQMWGKAVSEYVQSHVWNYASAWVYDVKTFMEFELLGDPTIRIYNPDYHETLNVPEDCATIQGAINAAYDGDTILVSSGTYYENLVVNKTVSLIGENVATTILFGGSASPVINITMNDSYVGGFAITGGSMGILLGSTYLDRTSQNTIFGNHITNTGTGIYVTEYSSRNSILVNNIEAGIGISLNSDNNTVCENNITGNGSGNRAYAGILTGDAIADWHMGNDISRNKIQNSTYGIYLYGGSSSYGGLNYNLLEGNEIASNDYGIFVMASIRNEIIGNNVTANLAGITLYPEALGHYGYWASNGNMLSENNVTNNQYGILIRGCANNDVIMNDITGNDYGIDLGWVDNMGEYRYSQENRIVGNNLADNGQGVYADTSLNTTIAGNNITNNEYYGILLSASNFTSISGNNLANNGVSIYSDYSSYSSIAGNNMTNSSSGIDASMSSLYNSVIDNNISNCELGISYVYDSSFYSIVGNTIVNSGYAITLFEASNDGIIRGNTVMNSSSGISNLSFCANISIIENTLMNNSVGISIDYTHSINIQKNIITDNEDGIFLHSADASIVQNEISGSTHGIYLISSTHNEIKRNNITANDIGIYFDSSDYSNISENNIAANRVGVYFSYSSNDTIYHNNFVGNVEQVYSNASISIWDDGYASGGNYWSDYAGIDANNDLIGDTPYVIDVDNVDHYPLMVPWEPVTDLAGLVVQGQDNTVYIRTYNVTSTSWAGWNALPGATCDCPATARVGNELHMVVRGMDGNTLWHGYANLVGGGFSGWTPLTGSTPSAPTLTSNTTHLCLIVRGQDNRIYYRFYTVATRTWSDWSVVPSGSTGDSPAAAMLANKLHIVVRGSDGSSIWHCNVDLSTQVFSGWQLVGGATPSAPTLAASEARNEVCLVVRGADNSIYRNTWAGASWAGWTALPTGATPDAPAAAILKNRLHIVVRGMDGISLYHSSIDLDTNSFVDWTLVSGSTPSAPTLAS